MKDALILKDEMELELIGVVGAKTWQRDMQCVQPHSQGDEERDRYKCEGRDEPGSCDHSQEGIEEKGGEPNEYWQNAQTPSSQALCVCAARRRP